MTFKTITNKLNSITYFTTHIDVIKWTNRLLSIYLHGKSTIIKFTTIIIKDIHVKTNRIPRKNIGFEKPFE